MTKARSTADRANDPVTKLALDIQAAFGDHGECTERDMHRRGWTDAEIKQHRQQALALVRRWQDEAAAVSAGLQVAVHDVTPSIARRASSQIGTARSKLDFLTTKLVAAGSGQRRAPANTRAVAALDEAIDLLTATRRDLTGEAWAPKASAASRAAA